MEFEKPQLHHQQTKARLFFRVRDCSFHATHVLNAANTNLPNAILFGYNS